MAKKSKPASTDDKTLVTFLLDRTGSMSQIKDATIEAFNAYLEGLKKNPTGIDFTFLQFDSISLDKVCVAVPVAQAPALTDANYQPRASTPLIDACVKTIKAVEQSIASMAKAPKVVVCIQTDGEENCSTAHTWDELNRLIKEKTAAGWQFNFMGAGIDAYAQGAKMGIAVGSTLSYNAQNLHATRSAFAATANNTAAYSSGIRASTGYDLSQKMSAGDVFDPVLGGHKVKHPAKAPILGHLLGKTATQSLIDDLDLTS